MNEHSINSRPRITVRQLITRLVRVEHPDMLMRYRGEMLITLSLVAMVITISYALYLTISILLMPQRLINATDQVVYLQVVQVIGLSLVITVVKHKRIEEAGFLFVALLVLVIVFSSATEFNVRVQAMMLGMVLVVVSAGLLIRPVWSFIVSIVGSILEIALIVLVPIPVRDDILFAAVLINLMSGGMIWFFAASLERAIADAYEHQAKAETANQLKIEFLRVTSHELKTPLNAIIGYVDCLLNGLGVSGPDLSSDQRNLLERVKGRSKDLLGSINDILDMSRLEAHRIEVEREIFSPTDVLFQNLKDFAFQAADKGIGLKSAIASDMPAYLIGDVQLISRVLSNLLSNAVKFTQSGYVLVDFRRLDAEHWQFSVEDTGIGIPVDKHAVIFDPFRQVDSGTRRNYGGTGLGLAIAHSSVELMDGKIEVHSTPNVGTKIIVTLPAIMPVDEALGERNAA